MTVNPALAQILQGMADMPPIEWAYADPAHVRQMLDRPVYVGEPLAMARVEDIVIPLDGRDLEARIYIPLHAGETPACTIYFHGGGWVLGTLETHDAQCRALAQASGCAFVSLDYRLAPETVYPGPVEDCYEATRWLAQNAKQLGLSSERMAVAGDSAGANLAAATAILARDRGGPEITYQLLIYPITDADFETPSYQENGAGNYFLSTAMMRWFWHHYLGATPASQAPLAAILQHSDLAGVASATVITAQYDPLKDEGEALATRLAGAGVAVDSHCAPGMVHGFLGFFQAVPDAMVWIELAGAKLRKALAS